LSYVLVLYGTVAFIIITGIMKVMLGGGGGGGSGGSSSAVLCCDRAAELKPDT